MSTLCIIDAQEHFWETAKTVKKQMTSALTKAFEAGDNLVVVEFEGFGNTHRSLQPVIRKFSAERMTFAMKYANGGGKEVLRAMRNKGFDESLVRVCGVNRCYCVWSTVMEMIEHGLNGGIELIENAVGCHKHCCNDPARVSDRLMQYREMGVGIN